MCKHLKPHQHPSQTIREIISADHNGSNGARGSAASFVEECVVRAEVAVKLCFYNPDYATYEGFPSWASKRHSLKQEMTNENTYIPQQNLKEQQRMMISGMLYQMQMVTSGKMHGYLRTY